MKKIYFLPFLAFVTVLLSSCGNSTVTRLDNPADSLAYAQGVRAADGFTYNATQRLGVDSTLIGSMMKGMEDAFFNTSEKQRAYNIGVQYGVALREQFLKNVYNRMLAYGDSAGLNEELFFDAFKAVVYDEELVIDASTAAAYCSRADYLRKLRYNEVKYADVRASSDDFMEVNASQPGVHVTESGLQYRIEKQGNGPKPTENSRVVINYKGTLLDGTEFDSSYQRNKPSTFSVDKVVKGFSEGLQLMPVGSKYTLYVPYDLGYKDNDNNPKIKPYSTLIFEVELLSIEK